MFEKIYFIIENAYRFNRKPEETFEKIKQVIKEYYCIKEERIEKD